MTISYICGFVYPDITTLVYFLSQSQLSGFYDPCIGEEKYLKIRYEFRNAFHEATFRDDECVRVPKQCKLILMLYLISL